MGHPGKYYNWVPQGYSAIINKVKEWVILVSIYNWVPQGYSAIINKVKEWVILVGTSRSHLDNILTIKLTNENRIENRKPNG